VEVRAQALVPLRAAKMRCPTESSKAMLTGSNGTNGTPKWLLHAVPCCTDGLRVVGINWRARTARRQFHTPSATRLTICNMYQCYDC
jgi:hypothetical protein